jgi:hypothetical protein
MDPITKTLVAGSGSGIIADLVTHPICTIKARLMVQGAGAGGKGAVMYNGLIDGIIKTTQAEGPQALYKGVGAVVIGAAPAQALFFGGMTFAQTYGTDLVGASAANFGSGFFAQLVGSLAWVPMEVVKEKMMIQGQVQVSRLQLQQLNTITDYCLVAFCTWILTTRPQPTTQAPGIWYRGWSRRCVGLSFIFFVTPSSHPFAKTNQTIKEGIGGLYRGYVMQQVTYAPFNGAFSV